MLSGDIEREYGSDGIYHGKFHRNLYASSEKSSEQLTFRNLLGGLQ